MPSLDLILFNAALRHAILEQLNGASNWQPSSFSTLDEAFTAWKDRTPQAILVDPEILDHNEPRLAGVIQTRTPPALLFVVGEAVPSLDEHLVTEHFPLPLRLGYLLARLHFYQQPHHHETNAAYRLGAWTFMPRSHKLSSTDGGKSVHLTHKESSLLEYLCQAKQAVSRDELLAAVWGYDGRIDTHTLETHIYLLRRSVPEGHNLFLVENGSYRINPAWLTN